MENFDQRRRHPNDDPRDRSRSSYEDRDGDRDRSDERERGREESRYARGGRSDRSSFSPDWSREGAEPRYSDDPYYSRNRERAPDEYLRGRDDSRRTDWPYERSGRDRGQDVERSRDENQDRHYRGSYSRSTTPFEYPGGSGYLYSESWTLHGPYAGRGPKGYKRSDQQIIDEACQRLERDGEIDASEIEVSAEDGVIRLRGTVQDRATKRRAEQCVESVYGARDVMNELRVSQPRESTQPSQSGVGSQGSQVTQSPQTRGGISSQQSTSASSTRPSSTTPPSEQAPKH